MGSRAYKPWALCGTWTALGVVLLALLGTPAKAALGSRLARGSCSLRVSGIGAALRPFADLPALPRTRAEAVAHELHKRSPTLGRRQALHTAYVLGEEADQAGIDPLLLLAVMSVESSYDHRAVSPAGAEGLMQIMPDTAVWAAPRLGLKWGRHRRFDPVLNVRLGSRYLAALDRQFSGRWELTLTAYNRGPGATRRILREHGGLPRDIRDAYATKVLRSYVGFKQRYAALTSADSAQSGRPVLR